MLRCEKCLKCFDFKSKLEKHINKSGCMQLVQIGQNMLDNVTTTEQIKCKFCNVYFSKKNIIRHMMSQKTDCYINRLKKDQKTIIENLTVNPKNMISNVINNMKPPKFVKRGKENVDHITKDVVLELFKNTKFIFICEELMKLVYFNINVPQNCSWSIAYPKNDNAGVAYNHDEDEFERKETKEIVEDKFSNMINLLVPVMQAIHKDTVLYESLSDMQQVNIVRFFYHLGMYQISKESPDVYEAMHRLCYEQRRIPMKLWGDLGYKGNHLSLKFH